MPILALNRKAQFEYLILETFQAGLSLDGVSVKAIRSGRINLTNCYIVNNRGVLNLINFTCLDKLGQTQNKVIPILLKTKERDTIIGRLSEKGISCVPLRLKTVRRWIKADIALVKGKKTYDKRESIKKRDLEREMRKEI
jgi:SsrA-binding protein